jgi:hypothetical protein
MDGVIFKIVRLHRAGFESIALPGVAAFRAA